MRWVWRCHNPAGSRLRPELKSNATLLPCASFYLRRNRPVLPALSLMGRVFILHMLCRYAPQCRTKRSCFCNYLLFSVRPEAAIARKENPARDRVFLL